MSYLLINTSLLTSGSETLSCTDNCFIFDSVFRSFNVLTKHHPASKYTHTYFFLISFYSFTIFSYSILYDKIVFFLFSCAFSI